MWEEDADSWALESLPPLPHCSPSGQQPPPLPQDKGPSVCSAPRQTAGLSLPLPLEWSALTMTPPCPLRRARHTPLCTNLFLLKDPETKAGKPGVGAGPVCWVKPQPFRAVAGQPRLAGLSPAKVGVGRNWRPGPSPGGLDIILFVSCQTKAAPAWPWPQGGFRSGALSQQDRSQSMSLTKQKCQWLGRPFLLSCSLGSPGSVFTFLPLRVFLSLLKVS